MEKKPKKRGPKGKPRNEIKIQVYFMVKRKHGLAFSKDVIKLLKEKYND